MASLTKLSEAFVGDITLSKQTGTVVTARTEGTYADKDIQFNLDVKSATSAADTASADVTVESTSGSAGGTNISNVIGTKTTTEPSSGYYIRVNASGSGRSKITDAGWIGTGSLEAASTNAVKYFPVTAGGITVSGGTLTTTANYSGTPTVNINIDSQTTSGVTITDTAQSSGYYVKLDGSTEQLTGTTTVTSADVTDVRTAGYIPDRTSTTIVSGSTCSPTVTVNAASKTRYLCIPSVTAAISGGALSGTATASSSSASISDSTNDSGVSIATACTATRAAVSCTATTAGWASGSIDELASGSQEMTSKTYYINGVTLTAPESGTRSFSVTVPNGASTVTFTFNVDSSGNVIIN